jgi:hypothetical protein
MGRGPRQPTATAGALSRDQELEAARPDRSRRALWYTDPSGVGRTIEMHWACSACGNRNLGRHKTCANCGDPKDASEPWVMPGDLAAAPTITDPALLRQARAGADWECAFCRSHQRRLDGVCARCGASASDGERVPVGGARAAAPPAGHQGHAPPPRPRGFSPVAWISTVAWISLATLSGFALTCVVGGAYVAMSGRPSGPLHAEKPPSEVATLERATWTYHVRVERYRLVDEEGFAESRPADALAVASLGMRHHHDEQVLDRYETETYQEQVPYQDVETYTEQEACGEDCTALPQSCSESCTANDNGFATCSTTCSGGGRSCTPRYCTVMRTRSVTRFRSETRTRQVPRYRSEPREAEYFRWRAWRWWLDREVDARGGGDEAPRWPSDEALRAPTPLGEGELEREARTETYELVLRTADGDERSQRMRDRAQFDAVRAHRRWHVDPVGGARLLKPVMPGGDHGA